MARVDSVGFFWEDFDKVKGPKVEVVKRTAPERFWERPDYLPGLADALVFAPDLYSDSELMMAAATGERLVYDIEVYPNYCLFALKGITSGKILYFELGEGFQFHAEKLHWVLHNFCIVNFNGRKFDFPVTSVAFAGKGPAALWNATCMLIVEELQTTDVYRKYKSQRLDKVNQIDLIELTALAPGLKVCAGRLHAPRLQDLPFKPGTVLTPNQIIILRRYCINDLDNTIILYKSVLPEIELREAIGKRYNLDLRSHSRPQMAEAIISHEIKRISGKKHIQKSVIPPGTWYRYQTPSFVRYSSELLNYVLRVVQSAAFVVGEDGSIIMPPELEGFVFQIGKGSYKLGLGGLHSQEKTVAHYANDEYFIADTDATSYYPKLIINAGMAPDSLGHDFLNIYAPMMEERVVAKHNGNMVLADCFKIVLNGSFGKMGNKWSIMYAPNLMIQVTITGQLSILMLVERFELAGIEVLQVNTDGVVARCKRDQEALFEGIVKQWGRETNFETEEIRYSALFSRDVNNYFAVYEKPQKGQLFKGKGVYSKTSSSKNAITEICVDAVKQYVATGKLLSKTIKECKDIRKFTSMRFVAGGAVKGDPTEPGKPITSGVYLGKIIRWYYAVGEVGEIVRAVNGNKVALTDGARPLMDLPDEFPNDVNYEWYIAEAEKILVKIGHTVV